MLRNRSRNCAGSSTVTPVPQVKRCQHISFIPPAVERAEGTLGEFLKVEIGVSFERFADSAGLAHVRQAPQPWFFGPTRTT